MESWAESPNGYKRVEHCSFGLLIILCSSFPPTYPYCLFSCFFIWVGFLSFREGWVDFVPCEGDRWVWVQCEWWTWGVMWAHWPSTEWHSKLASSSLVWRKSSNGSAWSMGSFWPCLGLGFWWPLPEPQGMCLEWFVISKWQWREFCFALCRRMMITLPVAGASLSLVTVR